MLFIELCTLACATSIKCVVGVNMTLSCDCTILFDKGLGWGQEHLKYVAVHCGIVRELLSVLRDKRGGVK